MHIAGRPPGHRQEILLARRHYLWVHARAGLNSRILRAPQNGDKQLKDIAPSVCLRVCIRERSEGQDEEISLKYYRSDRVDVTGVRPYIRSLPSRLPNAHSYASGTDPDLLCLSPARARTDTPRSPRPGTPRRRGQRPADGRFHEQPIHPGSGPEGLARRLPRRYR